MTLYDLIYVIGCGVAFMMAFVGFLNSAQVKEEIEDDSFVIFCKLFDCVFTKLGSAYLVVRFSLSY